MNGLTFIDCATIGTLIEAHRDAAASDTRLTLINSHRLVLRILQLLDLLIHLTDPLDPAGGLYTRP